MILMISFQHIFKILHNYSSILFYYFQHLNFVTAFSRDIIVIHIFRESFLCMNLIRYEKCMSCKILVGNESLNLCNREYKSFVQLLIYFFETLIILPHKPFVKNGAKRSLPDGPSSTGPVIERSILYKRCDKLYSIHHNVITLKLLAKGLYLLIGSL